MTMMSWQHFIGRKRNVFEWLTKKSYTHIPSNFFAVDFANSLYSGGILARSNRSTITTKPPDIFPPAIMSPPPSNTYTSIPLSPGDVISRSIHNLTAAVSRHRPWSEFVSSAVFGRPESVSAIFLRARTNFRYFFVNYSLVVGACAALALVGSPVALLVVGSIVAFWLLFHFFREDPLILWGFQVGDRVVVVFLALAFLWAIWFTSSAVSLAMGVGIGLLLCAAHAVFRNSDGLFLDEDDAVAGGLIGSDRQ